MSSDDTGLLRATPSHPILFAVAVSLPVNPSDVARTYLCVICRLVHPLKTVSYGFSLCLSPNYKLNHSHLSSACNLLGFLNSKKGICNSSLEFQEALWALISNISLKAGQAPFLGLKEPGLLLPLFLIFTLLPLLCTVSCLLWSFSLHNFDLLKKIIYQFSSVQSLSRVQLFATP